MGVRFALCLGLAGCGASSAVSDGAASDGAGGDRAGGTGGRGGTGDTGGETVPDSDAGRGGGTADSEVPTPGLDAAGATGGVPSRPEADAAIIAPGRDAAVEPADIAVPPVPDGATAPPDVPPLEPDAAPEPPPHFSFFVTSMESMVELSGSPDGFGGDLRFGEEGPGAGLRGADAICSAIAEWSMPGAASKTWRAFLSVATDENGRQVDAIDRVGDGPWYDRLGRVVAMTRDDLLHTRPQGADAVIINDLPNEFGIPNHAPDPGRPQVDNHDILTGTDTDGRLVGGWANCRDWTSAVGDWLLEGRPRCGHSWIRRPGGPGGGMPEPWMSTLDEAGCRAGINIVEMGPPNLAVPTVGSGGGYGGIYCFALTP